jgi:hypothetical protein
MKFVLPFSQPFSEPRGELKFFFMKRTLVRYTTARSLHAGAG